MKHKTNKVKFETGRIVATRGIDQLISGENGLKLACEISDCFFRHQSGDWGNLCDEDKEYNDWALRHNCRLLSAYEIGEEKTKIWIITEWNRSCTTILLPDEY